MSYGNKLSRLPPLSSLPTFLLIVCLLHPSAYAILEKRDYSGMDRQRLYKEAQRLSKVGQKGTKKNGEETKEEGKKDEEKGDTAEGDKKKKKGDKLEEQSGEM